MCFQIIPLCPACEEPAGLGEEIIYADDVCAGTCQGDDVCGTTTRRLTQHELAVHPDFECLTPGCPRAERRNHSGSSSTGASAAASVRGGPSTTRGGRHCRRVRSAEERSDRGEEEGSETGDEDDRDNDSHNNNDDDAEVQAARDRAKQFLRTRYQGCLSLCIIPFSEQAGDGSTAAASMQTGCTSDSDTAALRGTMCTLPYRTLQKPALRRSRHGRPWSKKRGKPWGAEEEAILWKLRRRGMDFDEIAKHIDRTERGCYDRYNKLRNEGYGRAC